VRRLLPVGYPGLEFFRRQRFAVKKPLDFVAIHGLKGIELCLRFRSYDGGGCGSSGRAAAEAKGKDQKQEKNFAQGNSNSTPHDHNSSPLTQCFME